MSNTLELAKKLIAEHSLTHDEFVQLIDGRDSETTELLRSEAEKVRKDIYGNTVFTRGLIELTNYCKNNCIYCGIRAGNANCDRYRLSMQQILECADEGYELGFRTFVLQGGEDPYYLDPDNDPKASDGIDSMTGTQRICEIVRALKERHPDCAVTLSVGERSRESYQALYNAGADRYLLRHETANKAHYEKLHPKQMSFDNRMRCLKDLHEIGFQTGCGFMVGSPWQTTSDLADDLKFIEEFSPEMVGIGPFIPHHQTPFADKPQGDLELTVFLLSVIRLIKPNVLLPATTALGTIAPNGRELGILAGANVVMPNLSPTDVRKKYELYDNKIHTGVESAQSREALNDRMKSIGYELSVDRGDIIKN